MDISVELVSTVLLGMLAMSAPSALSFVLFRIMVKEGLPLESQKFRRKCLLWSLFWLGIFLVGLFLVFFGGKASMPDRLREASLLFKVNLVMGPLSFLLILLLLSLSRKHDWLKVPHFIDEFPLHFFILVIISWTVSISQFLGNRHWL